MLIYGTPVENTHVRSIVASLFVTADPVAHTTAHTLARALDNGERIVAIKHYERDAILSVLGNPPDGLAELRGVLARDHSGRANS